MPSKDLEVLKRIIPAYRVIGQHVQLRHESGEWIGKCPFHEENTPSFKVFQDKSGAWLFKCFGCGVAGNVFQFLERFLKIDFQEAVAKVEEFAAIDAKWRSDKVEVTKAFSPALERPEEKTLPIVELAKYEAALVESPAALKWLQDERGITPEVARKVRLGFRQTVTARDESARDILDKGWFVFACIQGDKVVAVKYRSMVRKRPGGFQSMAGMATALYNTETINPFEDLMLTVGEFDAIVFEQHGFRAVSLPSDSFKVTPEMRDQMKEASSVFLSGDTDPSGCQAMERLQIDMGQGVYMFKWPQGFKDANDFFLRGCARDGDKFTAEVELLKGEARKRIMPGFTSAQEEIRALGGRSPMEDPERLRMPPEWTPDIDDMAYIPPGGVVSVYATYTKTGKTTWVMPIAAHESIRGHVTLYYSAELSGEEYARLLVSYLADHDRNLSVSEVVKERALQKLGLAPLYIGYSPDKSRIKDVLDLLEAAIKRFGATRVVLDHLHFYCRGRDPIQEQAEAMQRIKNMAVKYHLVFIVVGQSRKQVQQGSKNRPSEIADAKGSESFTSDAHAIFRLHRNIRTDIDWDNPPAEMLMPECDVRCEARTRGPGKAARRMLFIGTTSRFVLSTKATPPSSDFMGPE